MVRGGLSGGSDIRLRHVPFGVFGDKSLSRFEIVSEERFKHRRGIRRVCGRYLYETSRRGIHGRFPHHLGLVFAESLRTLKCVLSVSERRYDLLLLLLVVCEVDIVLCRDLKQRRFGDKHPLLLDQRREKAVEHCKKQRAYLESVLVGIRTYYYFRPTERVIIEFHDIALDF